MYTVFQNFSTDNLTIRSILGLGSHQYKDVIKHTLTFQHRDNIIGIKNDGLIDFMPTRY